MNKRTNSPKAPRVYVGHNGTSKATGSGYPSRVMGYFPTELKATKAVEAFDAVRELEKKLKKARLVLERRMKWAEA